MARSFSVPFHFAVELLVLVVAIGAVVDAVRAFKRGAGGWAIGQGLGFFALGVAHALHGSLIRPEEGDGVGVALRVVGFAALAISARPAALIAYRAPVVAAGAAPAMFVPGVHAEWAGVAGLAALAAAARGVAAHRRDQDPATFAFAAGFVSFAAAEVLIAIAPETGGAMLTLAHGARAAAALFLARWLWSSFVGSLRLRVVATFVVLLTLAVLVVSGALNAVIARTLEREDLKRLSAAGNARLDKLGNIGSTGKATVETFAQVPSVQAVLDDQNPQWADPGSRSGRTLLANSVSDGILKVAADTDFAMLVDRDGGVLGSCAVALLSTGRGDRPCSTLEGHERFRPLPRVEAVLLSGSDVVRAALDGNETTSLIATNTIGGRGNVRDQLVVMSAAPAVSGQRILGAVVAGSRVDGRFLNELSRESQAQATLIVGSSVAATTFGRRADVEAAIAAIRPTIEGFVEGTFTAPLRIGNATYSSAFVPARTEDFQLLGFLVLSQQGGAVEAAEQDMTRTLFLIALAGVAIAAMLAWVSGGRITRPIRSLTEAARELRAGHLEMRARVMSSDEVGTLGSAFNEMAAELQRKTGDLEQAAESEAALRARMESIVQSMGDGLIATDARGSIVTFNRAAEQLLRVKAERALGASIGDVLVGTTGAGRRLAESALTGRGSDGVLHVGSAGIPVALTSTPLTDPSGNETGRVVVVRDMSKVHQAERMKSEFLSNVSHELRTPITPIKGYAEILKRKRFSRDKTEQFLDGVLESTERLERIVEILVDFASIEAGRLTPRQQPVHVKGLLDDVAGRWRLRNGGHRFLRKGGRGLPAIRGDEKLLERALNELLDNAVKFSPDGGAIEVVATGENGRRAKPRAIRITVRDRGIGIEPEQMPELFQDFRQLDGSETRSYGGLGLGLAYVKRIVEVQGGTVEVESTPGKGSAFSLVLPAADEATKRPSDGTRRASASRGPVTRTRSAKRTKR